MKIEGRQKIALKNKALSPSLILMYNNLMEEESKKGFLTLREASKISGKSQMTIWRLIRKMLKGVKEGVIENGIENVIEEKFEGFGKKRYYIRQEYLFEKYNLSPPPTKDVIGVIDNVIQNGIGVKRNGIDVIDNVIDKPQNVIEGSKNVIDNGIGVIHKSENVIEKKRNVIENVIDVKENVIQNLKNVIGGVKQNLTKLEVENKHLQDNLQNRDRAILGMKQEIKDERKRTFEIAHEERERGDLKIEEKDKEIKTAYLEVGKLMGKTKGLEEQIKLLTTPKKKWWQR